MHSLKKYYEYELLIIIGIIIFFVTKRNNIDLDMFFHIKAGEVFLQKGILFHDIFSYTAYGRQWIPHEWLFEIGIYALVHFFGLASISNTIGILSVLQIGILYIFLKKIYKPPVFILSSLITIYTVGILFFLVPRPTIISNICFILTTCLILLYVYKHKNYLWLTVPIYIIWINIHASFVLAIGITGYYALSTAILSYRQKERHFLQQAQVLSLYTILFVLISFSPPLWGLQYQLLLEFIKNHSTLIYVTEWHPLWFDPTVCFLYTVLIAIFAGFIFFIRKKLSIKEFFYILPMLVLGLSAYLANRNLLYSFFGIAVAGAWIVKFLNKKIYRILYICCLLIFLFIYASMMRDTLHNSYAHFLHIPDNAASFIHDNNLQGNIFNDYSYGGYLLYRLYPQQKVFIDGRTDIYMCCELPLIQKLSSPGVMTNQQKFYRSFSSLLARYHIVIVLISPMDMALAEMNYLYEDHNWVLVFWDDNGFIFVKKNSLNDKIISEFGTQWITPFANRSFDVHHLYKAESEAQRRIHTADSAITRDILGQILVAEGKNTDAMKQFENALQRNPSYAPAYQHLLLLQQNL